MSTERMTFSAPRLWSTISRSEWNERAGFVRADDEVDRLDLAL